MLSKNNATVNRLLLTSGIVGTLCFMLAMIRRGRHPSRLQCVDNGRKFIEPHSGRPRAVESAERRDAGPRTTCSRPSSRGSVAGGVLDRTQTTARAGELDSRSDRIG